MNLELSLNESFQLFSICGQMVDSMSKENKTTQGRFLYALIRNREKLRTFLIANEVKQPEQSPEVKAYGVKEKELIESFQTKDEKNIITVKDEEGLRTALKVLQDENTELLTEWKVKVDLYNEALSKLHTVEVYHIKEEILPSDMSTQNVEGLYKLIVE